MRFKIIKYLEAKSIKQALKLEPTAVIEEISKVEEPENTSELTPAIGFHIDIPYSDEGI